MTATRTDTHRPSVLTPGDYAFRSAIDTSNDRAYAAAEATIAPRLVGDHRSLTRCSICGAHLRYAVIWEHLPSGGLIVSGEDCAATVDEAQAAGVTLAVARLREEGKARREAEKLTGQVEAWLAGNLDLATGLGAAAADGDAFAADLLASVRRYGSLTDRQHAAAERMLVRRTADAARKAAQAAAPAPEVVPAPAGRTEVTGEVLSTRSQSSVYGVTLKMLVRDDRGFRVWSTVPAALGTVSRGDRIAFTATLEPKADDPAFAWASRPTAARHLADAA